MFSGIIEAVGTIQAIETVPAGRRLWIQAPFVSEIAVGNSIAHDGVCLSVIAIKHRFYCVEVVAETLQRTTLGQLELQSPVNLERSLPVNGRLEGHIVQGHVDTTTEVVEILPLGGDSFYFVFALPREWSHLVVEKGAIAINGISLTVASVDAETFRVAIIPWTYHHTNFAYLRKGDRVNVEFDILAKYLWKWAQERRIT